MSIDRLAALLPCYGLESFDFHQSEADSEQLLSAWSSLWHPLLLTTAKSIPRWHAAMCPPQAPSGHLIAVPECCEATLPDDWLAQAEGAGAFVLRHFSRREEALAAAIGAIAENPPTVDADLAADFLALGVCHFQVELLTRKLRYMSMLDETAFQTATLAAADEAMKGDIKAARDQLQKAFDRLHEAREYFYPTEPCFLDLTLVAPSTIGAALRAELAAGRPRNLLVAAETLAAMASREPATLETLKEALADNRVAIVGGEDVEMPLPMLPPETIEAHLCRGLAAYEQILGRRPKVFGRRRFGLTPALPQILKRLGFSGVLHCTLDDGQFPTSQQSRVQWQGIDGATIDAVARLPMDVSRMDSFFQFTETLGNVLNHDQSSAISFAHWPGRTSPWYDDLRRIGNYGPVLGQFMTIVGYLDKTSYNGQYGHYRPDQYRSPYLTQDVAAGRSDPIGRWVRYFRRQAILETCHALHTMGAVCSTTVDDGEQRQKAERHMLAVDLEDSLNADDAFPSLDDRLAELTRRPLASLAQAVVGRASLPERGTLTINPWSFAQQACNTASLDVPAMGFVWNQATDSTPIVEVRKGWFGRQKMQEPPPMVAGHVLQNEFFQVSFDPHTGAIRAISDYHTRSPRLAQQIAMRLPQGNDPDDDGNYTIMAADEFTVTSTGPQLGEIVCRGRLMDRGGQCVAQFRQTTRAWRKCRVLDIQIDLDIERQPGPNPWDSYYAVRFAWKDQAAELYRSANMAVVATEIPRFESPYFVDIRGNKHRTTVLTGGLPYHRRLGARKLDTLLVVQGETSRSFRVGIGIDVPHPLAASLSMLAPPCVLTDQPRPTASTGWLFHLDCRNVLATQWEPMLAEDGLQVIGFRVCLLETDGQSVRLGLRCLRPVASAQKLNPGDVPPLTLNVEGDRVDIPLGSHQMTDVEVRFA